jgi:glutaredoxin 3
MLLAIRGYGHYNEHVVGSDLTREQFLELFPNARTVPQIVINGKLIGGYDNLVEYFEGTENGFGEQSI